MISSRKILSRSYYRKTLPREAREEVLRESRRRTILMVFLGKISLLKKCSLLTFPKNLEPLINKNMSKCKGLIFLSFCTNIMTGTKERVLFLRWCCNGIKSLSESHIE